MNTHEALSLVHALREEMHHAIYFTQACINISEADQESVRRLIILCRQLRSNYMPDNERAAHEYIKKIERQVTGKHKHGLRNDTRRALGDNVDSRPRPQRQDRAPAPAVRKLHRVEPEVLAIHGDHLSRVRRKRVD